jgi:hypothetical protein
MFYVMKRNNTRQNLGIKFSNFKEAFRELVYIRDLDEFSGPFKTLFIR